MSSNASGLPSIRTVRALARNPRVLLLDEVTSALDNRSPAVVQASLKRLGVTRVVIAHRPGSNRDADRIDVLEAGRIVESGRCEQLMQREGVFAALARRQLFQAHSGAFRRIQAHSGAFRRIQAHSGAFRRIQAHSGAFRRIQAHSGAFRRR